MKILTIRNLTRNLVKRCRETRKKYLVPYRSYRESALLTDARASLVKIFSNKNILLNIVKGGFEKHGFVKGGFVKYGFVKARTCTERCLKIVGSANAIPSLIT